MGRREDAASILRGEASDDPELLWLRACVHAVLGDASAALEALGRADQAGYRRPATAAPDPDLQALLGADERHARLMSSIARPR